ncbi:furin-like protease 2 isoform X2 [Lucilia cuprina]|uniref:furin-like protease 2 isoform X2 n=1 Tax=Lucilia cuprina TaxID=7375 RepID=UPI001F056ECF|nr:furin-like protease 2 isoform X2 [Lucilia cuprina]
MNLHHNPNNDDECDNSISSQTQEQQQRQQQQQQQHGNTVCKGQHVYQTQHRNSSNRFYQTGQLLQKKIITMSNASTTAEVAAAATTSTAIKLLNNTCPTVVDERQQQRHGQQHQHVQPLQKWLQRPRGQTLAKNAPVIWNLLNNKMFKLHNNVCKYFLVMFVVILTSFPAATVMALPSLQDTTNTTTSTTNNVIQQIHNEYKNDKIATISQSVNSTSNYNSNNNDTTKNSAVKIILNDYNDAFLQMLPMTEQKQKQHHSSVVKNHLLEMEPDVTVIHDDLLDSFRGTHSLPHQPMYTNEFAVHIPAGKDMADLIADKYGFINMGQIGSLQDYYLFHHKRISKRSLKTSDEHHSALNAEPEVRWLEQQHEKIRQKRDGSFSSIAGYSPYDVVRPSTGFGSMPTTRLSYHPTSVYRPLVPRAPRIQYRDAGPHTIFPDPLFKEQWYLNGGAKDGLDMNIGPAWQKGYTGKGVVVSILDDGIQTNHPDLAQNYVSLYMYFFVLIFLGNSLIFLRRKNTKQI